MMHPVKEFKEVAVLDPAIAALIAAHPEGAPADVYEPQEPEAFAVMRAILLADLGDVEAVKKHPLMFPETCGVSL